MGKSINILLTINGIKHYKYLLEVINDILIKKEYIINKYDLNYNNYIYYKSLSELSRKDKLNIDRGELNSAFRIIYNINCKC